MAPSEKIQFLIDELRENPNSFAVSLGSVSVMAIRNILSGKYGITNNMAKKITGVYTNVNIDWLLGNDNKPYLWGDVPIKKEPEPDKLVVEEPKIEYEDTGTGVQDEYIKVINKHLALLAKKDEQIDRLLNIIENFNK